MKMIGQCHTTRVVQIEDFRECAVLIFRLVMGRELGSAAACALCGELFVLTLSTVELSMLSGRDGKAALHTTFVLFEPPPVHIGPHPCFSGTWQHRTDVVQRPTSCFVVRAALVREGHTTLQCPVPKYMLWVQNRRVANDSRSGSRVGKMPCSLSAATRPSLLGSRHPSTSTSVRSPFPFKISPFLTPKHS
jgi:hypothetical protein